MTVDRVLVQIDTDRSVQLVNRQQFYVSISRARIDGNGRCRLDARLK